MARRYRRSVAVGALLAGLLVAHATLAQAPAAEDTEEAPVYELRTYTAVDGQLEALLDHLHATDRNLTILGVAPDMGSAFIEQLCPTRREMLNPSEDNMLNALCNAVLAPCGPQ